MTVAVENFSETLGAGFAGLNRVHPKGVLIAGTLQGLREREQDSLNHFRQGLFSLTMITYDEVLQRLRILFDHEPTSEVQTVDRQDSPSVASETGGDIPF
jgi:hypothetical protein